jgi:hypothetical protein
MTLDANFVLLADDGILFENVAEFLDSVKTLCAYTVIENDGINFET